VKNHLAFLDHPPPPRIPTTAFCETRACGSQSVAGERKRGFLLSPVKRGRSKQKKEEKKTYLCPRFSPSHTLCAKLHNDGCSHYPPADFIAVGFYQRSCSVRILRCPFVIALQPYPNPVHPPPFGVLERRRTVPKTNPAGLSTQKAGGATRKREAIPSPAVVGCPVARAPTPNQPAL
jgi:hypothetical protein